MSFTNHCSLQQACGLNVRSRGCSEANPWQEINAPLPSTTKWLDIIRKRFYGYSVNEGMKVDERFSQQFNHFVVDGGGGGFFSTGSLRCTRGYQYSSLRLVVDHKSQITDCRLQITDCRSQVVDFRTEMSFTDHCSLQQACGLFTPGFSFGGYILRLVFFSNSNP